MKRLMILTIVFCGFAALCWGQYRSRVSPLKIVQLTEPRLKGPVSLEEALAKRRSVRQFTAQPLNSAQVSQLAWAGQGITEPQRGFRTAPSAGAIYPIVLYFATQDGMFVYNPNEHSLAQTSNQDMRIRLATAALNQGVVANTACDIIVAGSVRRLTAEYRNKARRYMLLEAGYVAQNIQLQAVSLGLGSVPIGAFAIRDVSKVCRLPADLEPLLIICVGYPTEQVIIKTGEEEREAREMERTRAKKAVLIIASQNFRDEELFETRFVLNKAGVETVIASSRTGPVRGMLGGIAQAAIHINELRVDDYDAIIFIGGLGAREYFDSPVALNIAREAADKGKVLAAICIAPAVLANAGLLNGLRATSFLSERDRLQLAGAEYTGFPVERDGLIITGSGPMASVLFGEAIADALTGR